MNIKKIAALSITCATIMQGVSAATTQTIIQGASAVITQLNEEQLAQALLQEQLTVNDPVLYDKHVYTVDQFKVTENINFYDVVFTLKRPLQWLGTTWGNEFVEITVTKGPEPLHPTQKIRNEIAQTNTVHDVNVYSYKQWDEDKIGCTSMGIVGTFFVAAMLTMPNTRTVYLPCCH